MIDGIEFQHMDEEKFARFSKFVLLLGVFFALYFLINSVIHTYSKIKNPPPASQFMGPNADK